MRKRRRQRVGASGEEMPRKQIHHSPPAGRQEQEEQEEQKQGMEDGFKGVCVLMRWKTGPN